jgi:hypothetical protein
VTNGTFDEAARNKFNTGTTVADLASGKSVKIQNVDQNGTSDKVYSATDETTRNTVPDLTKIPTAATGGPATWKQLNVDRDGTMDLDAAKTAYENSRNSGASTGKIVSGQSIVQKGTTYNGTAAAEAHTANQVIHSAGGNFVDETVLAGNLKTGITAGLGVNGTVIPEAHTANQVLKSAGGNWDDDNILSQLNATANVKNTLAVGLGWTGGLTSGSSDPDTIVSSAGGNWNDSHLLPGDEVNVASGVAFGLSQVGTGIMNIPIHYTPRFGITTFDSATFTDQNVVPLKKPLPMDLNGYSAFLTLEQLESDDSFQLLQLSLEGQAFSGRFV